MRWVPNIDYHPGFVPALHATELFDVLRRELPWRQQDIVLFGKPVRQPRLMSWASDPGVRYQYSGLQLNPQPWHPALTEARRLVEGELGLPFNSVLANAYRDGRDSMGWHADDEPELGTAPVIASLSLGEVRRFRVRPRPGSGSETRACGIDLAHGSLLVMREGSQSLWQHCVPKSARPAGLRINLTFRHIIAGQVTV